MRGTDARRAQIGGPDSIAQVFQVKTYSGEPFATSRARNLLPKDRCSFEVGDEVAEVGPEVPRILFSLTFTALAEGLAGAGASDDSLTNGPAGELEGFTPSSNPGKKVVLSVVSEFIRIYI